MDSLPPDLISRVVDCLETTPSHEPKPQLTPYATVSRQWQLKTERRIFPAIYLHSANRPQKFQQVVASNTYRQSCIRYIDLMVELESYDDKARARFEIHEEQQQNNKIFTVISHSLLVTLTSWPADTTVTLVITAQTPSDSVDLNGQWERKQREQAVILRQEDLFEQRYETS
ncbi:hypothetical protein N7508_000637 [Penicillium antarcticum]|uniref:uncharacterized protein n=1 Tax=Penicillium antarcticum TaxID=416450 RepID=UPI00238AA8F8|nr:uncharacterized protein N7508_000637 [Penicillium antarcticum]KAJ5320354.1 hypothetical protein N7508_000637 [Penicillium antarcticum]